MTRLALCLVATLGALATGCTLFPGEGGGTTGSGSACSNDEGTPAVAEALMLVDPSTLQCDTYYPSTCDPACGEACPDVNAAAGAPEAIPSWGSCQSACRQLDETDCEASPMCRVALNYDAYYSIGAEGSASGFNSDFMGCYPIDTGLVATGPCDTLGAADCASTSACTALYHNILCNDGSTNSVGCTPEFAACIPAQQQAGSCTGPVDCDLAISCPANTTPGIAGGCYTGACIPDGYCPATP